MSQSYSNTGANPVARRPGEARRGLGDCQFIIEDINDQQRGG